MKKDCELLGVVVAPDAALLIDGQRNYFSALEQVSQKALSEAWSQGGLGKDYRQLLLGLGQEVIVEAKVKRKGMKKEMAEEEIAALERQESDLAISKLIHHRIRYFSDGVVIGGREFVDDFFNGNRERFGGKRKTGARKPRGALSGLKGKLWSLRDLKS